MMFESLLEGAILFGALVPLMLIAVSQLCSERYWSFVKRGKIPHSMGQMPFLVRFYSWMAHSLSTSVVIILWSVLFSVGCPLLFYMIVFPEKLSSYYSIATIHLPFVIILTSWLLCSIGPVGTRNIESQSS